jgi:uncharacterized protein
MMNRSSHSDSKAAAMPAPEPREVFQALVYGVTQRKFDELPDLYAEDTVVEHPFLGPGQRLEGREALREHFAAAAPLPLKLEARDVAVHQTADPEVIVVEFVYDGIITTTGQTFSLPAIFVMRIRDGLIVESRDYGNHLALAHATGRVPELLAMFDG